MATININEFDQHLENEFSRLGFNYHEIKANGINNTDEGRYKMFTTESLDEPYLDADCFGVDFIVVKAANELRPVIETMNTFLFCQTGYDEYIPLVNKTYSAGERSLPTKDQLLAETKELLKIKNTQRVLDQNFNQDTTVLSEINDFDKHLKNKFSGLGFNYQEIKANGTRSLDSCRVEMFLVDYFNTPHPLADGLAVIFTVRNPGNDQSAMIEAMQATLFNDSLYGKFTPLMEKTYLAEKCGLPDKEEVTSELNALLRLKQQADKGITNEFARLGFDLTDLLNSAERVNEHEILLSKTVELDIRFEPGIKVNFTFSVINSPAEQMYSIEHFTAVATRNVPGSGDRVLFENDYFCKDAPLPTKGEIFDEIAELAKRREIREKFGLHKDQSAQETTTHRKRL